MFGLDLGVWFLIAIVAVIFAVVGILVGRKRHDEVESVIEKAKQEIDEHKEKAKTEIIVEKEKAKEEVDDTKSLY